MAATTTICFTCGAPLDDVGRVILVRGRGHHEHCSEACLLETAQALQAARDARFNRLILRLVVIGVVLGGGRFMWQRHRRPISQTIAFDATDYDLRIKTAPPVPASSLYGPAWPPTEADWMYAFDRVRWVYPLPGPLRRPPTADDHVLDAEPLGNRPPECREEHRCGVDLGGELWGEHVYAALDGVVERVQRGPGGKHGEGPHLRIAHLGGMVYTQYFNLAGVPRTIGRGTHVKAGEVIGLVGDTGPEGASRHLHFALSVRPSGAFPEVYWDPTPLMAKWPLHVPPHGTVAGFLTPDKVSELGPRRPR